MSMYQCEQCGCEENTANGWYWANHHTDPKYDRKQLCSACGPPDCTIRKLGVWHGEFERTFYPLGSMETGPDGNLRKKEESHGD